jgi:hypothetical protein
MSSDSDSESSPSSRLCSRCQVLKLNESKYGGFTRSTQLRDGARKEFLQISRSSSRVLSSGPHATGIGDYTALFLNSFNDDWPDLPDLRARAMYCGFCKFLREGLRSDDVRLAILDQAKQSHRSSLENGTLPIKVTFSHSWEPERRGLKAQFVSTQVLVLSC